MKNYLYDVYMLCPVRNATEKEKEFLENYRNKLLEKGLKVHYPATDTEQEDETGGYRIVMDHAEEILNSRSIHTYWNPSSTGSKVDLGSGIVEHKRRGLDLLLMNRKFVKKIVTKQKKEGMTKSYEMVLLKLDEIADDSTRLK